MSDQLPEDEPPPYVDEDDRRFFEAIEDAKQRLTPDQFVEFLAQMSEENHGPPGPPKNCSLCNTITESPPEMAVSIGDKDIPGFCLCSGCRRLMYTDDREFFRLFHEKYGHG